MTTRFEREVDPDGTLEPGERARRVTAARKAYYERLSLLSARSRRVAAEARRAAAGQRTAAELLTAAAMLRDTAGELETAAQHAAAG